jgi:hypothetical protein
MEGMNPAKGTSPSEPGAAEELPAVAPQLDLLLGLKPEDSGLLVLVLCRYAARGSVGIPWLPVSSRCAGTSPGLTCAPQAVPPVRRPSSRSSRRCGPGRGPHRRRHRSTPDVEGFGPVLGAAGGAGLAGRLEPADLDEGAPVPGRLVLQHVHELPQPASCTLLASRVRASPFTARSSTAIAWFSRISLWRAGGGTRGAHRPLSRGRGRPSGGPWSRFLDPFCLRDSSRWAFFSFFSARRRNRGESIFVPSERTAK